MNYREWMLSSESFLMTCESKAGHCPQGVDSPGKDQQDRKPAAHHRKT